MVRERARLDVVIEEEEDEVREFGFKLSKLSFRS
jgi:hypothetical protein